MHKTRFFLLPIPDIAPGGYDLYSPRVRLISLPRTSLHVTGEFEKHVEPILRAASTNAGRDLSTPNDHIVVPVHELQVHHIHDKFPEAVVLPEEFHVSARAQQSIR